jgi:hypothetical protein
MKGNPMPKYSEYSLGDLANLHRQGKLSDREYTRAGGICADHLNDEEYQRDAVRSTGLPGTHQYGPAGTSSPDHINKRANRRPDKEARVKGKAHGSKGLWPSTAHVHRVSANEFHPDWYSAGSKRQS